MNISNKIHIPFLFITTVLIIIFLTSCTTPSTPLAPPLQTPPPSPVILDALPHDASLHHLTNPTFVSISEANQFIDDNDHVLAINYGNEQKLYPLSILLWHEVINDHIADTPVLITYCPLCGSAEVYERTITTRLGKKQTLEFKTTGKVLDSAIIIEDTNTSSLFVELNGTAITGPLQGTTLSKLDASIVFYRDWKNKYPLSKVLSLSTGYDEPYGTDPYTPYYTNNQILLPMSRSDPRLHPKEPIIGIKIAREAVAFKESDIKKLGVVSYTLAGVQLRIQVDDTGSIHIEKKSTNETLSSTRAFWYVWAAHNPTTSIYSQ